MKAARKRAPPIVVKDPMVMGGLPVLRGTRVSVELLAASLKASTPRAELLKAYPGVTWRALDAAWAYVLRHPPRPQRRIGEALVGWTLRTRIVRQSSR